MAGKKGAQPYAGKDVTRIGTIVETRSAGGSKKRKPATKTKDTQRIGTIVETRSAARKKGATSSKGDTKRIGTIVKTRAAGSAGKKSGSRDNKR